MKHRIKYFLINLIFYGKAFAYLAMARLRHGECFVVESGFCCDTGHFSNERRYTNPWTAMRSLHDLNTEQRTEAELRAVMVGMNCVGIVWRQRTMRDLKQNCGQCRTRRTGDKRGVTG
mgnify:CR=1 FL=1